MNLVGDITALVHMQHTLGGLIGWFVQNTIQGLMTAVWAAIWPVAWIQHLGVGVTSLVLLAVAYAVYRVIHPAVARLLREGDQAG